MDKKDIINYSLIFLFGVLLVCKAFSPGFLIQSDNPVHLAESHFLVDNIKENKWISGISEYDYAGFPERTFQYQLGQWFVAILNLIFQIPVEIAYKIVMALSYLFPALALYFLLSKKFSRESALVSSLLFLIIPHNITKMFQGMWSLLLSLGFLILFIYYFDKNNYNPNKRQSVILSILMALTLLSHPYSTLMAGIFMIVAFFYQRIKNKKYPNVINYAIILLLSILFLAFYIGPSVELSIGWAAKAQVRPALDSFTALGMNVLRSVLLTLFIQPYATVGRNIIGTIIVSIPILIVAVLTFFGIKRFISQKNKDDFTNLMAIMLIVSFITSLGLWLLPGLNKLPIINIFEPERFVVFTQAFMLVFAAYLLNKMKFSFNKKHGITIILLILLVVYANTFIVTNKLSVTSENKEVRQVNDVWNWIKNNVNGNETRVLYQATGSNSNNNYLRDSHVLAPSYYFTKVPSLGVWMGHAPIIPTHDMVNTDAMMLFNKTVQSISDNEIKTSLELFNAKYIVSSEPILKQKLEKSILFKKEYETNDFAIFSLKNYNQSWIDFNGKYDILKFTNSEIIIKADNTILGNKLLIKKLYVPYWEANVEGKTTKIEDNRNMMQMTLENIGNQTIILKYKAVRLNYVIISVISIIAAMIIYSVSR